MLRNLSKLTKRESGSGSPRQRITSADISAPTKESPNVVRHMRTVPLRQTSGTGGHGAKGLNSPDKVIRALYDYHSEAPKELSFEKGEFFFVVKEHGDWYHASNPATGAEGIVPREFFETIDKRKPSLGNSTSSPPSNTRKNSHNIPTGTSVSRTSTPLQDSTTQVDAEEYTRMGTLYAVVLYDFNAEKSDELTAHVGENLFICAHHNFEWFIAKPIGRLGGPGLVPVGFVSIIDSATGYATGNTVKEDVELVNLPTVQEWKSNIAKYKASNINLGSVDHLGTSPYHEPVQVTSTIYPEAATIIRASVENFGLKDDKYWFLVTCTLESGKSRRLQRYYQNFYDLQVQLLDAFPAESGKLRDVNGQWTKRIMPYIPGPVTYVAEGITKRRREDLNVYVAELIRLPEYISRSKMVHDLFSLKDNEVDQEFPNEEMMFTSLASLDMGTNRLAREESRLSSKFSRMSVNQSSTTLNSRPNSVQRSHRARSSNLNGGTKPIKIKIYYKDDIFALVLNDETTYQELKDHIAPRVDTEDFRMVVKLTDGEGEEVTNNAQVREVLQAKMKIAVYDI